MIYLTTGNKCAVNLPLYCSLSHNDQDKHCKPSLLRQSDNDMLMNMQLPSIFGILLEFSVINFNQVRA